MNLSREHWTPIHSNKLLERIMQERRRRTCVVAAFPDGNWGVRRYLDIQRIYQPRANRELTTEIVCVLSFCLHANNM